MMESRPIFNMPGKLPVYRFLIEFEEGWWFIFTRNLAGAAREAERFASMYGAVGIGIRREDCGCRHRVCLPGKPYLRPYHDEGMIARMEADWMIPGGRTRWMGCYAVRPAGDAGDLRALSDTMKSLPTVGSSRA